jgi:hypothetical protein
MERALAEQELRGEQRPLHQVAGAAASAGETLARRLGKLASIFPQSRLHLSSYLCLHLSPNPCF